MKKTIIMILAGILFVACQESLEDRCQREAKEFTEKSCPRHIDTEIVLDSMTFDKDSHTIGYCYTLQGSLDNPQRVDKDRFSEALLLEVKNSTNIKLYKVLATRSATRTIQKRIAERSSLKLRSAKKIIGNCR